MLRSAEQCRAAEFLEPWASPPKDLVVLCCLVTSRDVLSGYVMICLFTCL